jgi:hypothetical protein
MTGMEQEALDVIAGNEDGLHYYLLAQELKISAHYAYVICKGLERSGYVDFNAFKGICRLTEKGEDAAAQSWLFKIKSQRENMQKTKKENKIRISRKRVVINY